MRDPINPHDAFFKQILGKPELATDFLTQHLPATLLAEIELPTLVEQKESFVDEALRQHFSDLLYKVQTQSGTLMYVYLLFEHKSYPDQDVAFQLLRYQVRIWEKALAKQESRLPIIGLVVYHGQASWNVPLNFQATFGKDRKALPVPQASQYVPEFSYHLVDLSALSDDQIRGTIWLRVFQLLLKHIFDPNLGAQLYGILALLKELLDRPSSMEMLSTFLRYVSRAGVGASKEEITQTVTRLFPKEGGALMKTAYEEWKEEWIKTAYDELKEEWQEEFETISVQKGILQSHRQNIVLILQHRFTPAEEIVQLLTLHLARIQSVDTLRNLINAALQVPDLKEFNHRLEFEMQAMQTSDQSKSGDQQLAIGT